MHPDSHWVCTPLDFLSREEWWCSAFWRHYTHILYWMVPACWRWKKRRPIDRLPDIIWHKPSSNSLVFLAGITMMAYGAIFVAGWNIEFPTSTEQLLWRISSLVAFGCGCVGCILGYLGNEYYFKCVNIKEIENRSHMPEKIGHADRPALRRKRYKTWIFRRLDGIRNNSPEEDPMLYIPLRYWFPATVTCATYSLVRSYILVEDFVSLRSLPASAYTLVDWTR